MSDALRGYPRSVPLGDDSVVLRPMGAGDREALLAFSRALAGHDLLFLPIDITRPAVIDGWLTAMAAAPYFHAKRAPIRPS